MLLQALLIFLSIYKSSSTPIVGEPTCGYDACPNSDLSTLNVHIVPHSHDDVGWLKTYDRYYFEDVINVISSVVVALKQNPDRRFVQVETAFFQKWWDQQKDSVRADVQKLVDNGQLEIINAAWSMNDEAAVNYQFTIDQYTLGFRYLEDRLGSCSRPRVGWQIDPFGHSREQASINAQLGFDSLFFARLDYRDKIERLDRKAGDLLWRGSANFDNSDIYTSVMYNHYSAPAGFCFDIVCQDEPIINDEESPDYNYKDRVEKFTDFIKGQASKYPTNNIMVAMGDDFRYQAALASYINTDRLIAGFDLFPQTFENKTIKVFYSTPSCYAKAVNDFVVANNYQLEVKTDDFFPYADGVGSLVVGYFSSRPASKRFVHEGNTILQTAKQLAAAANQPYEDPKINSLKEAMGVLQHHDAITGTELIDVTQDYHRLLHKGISETNDAINSILSSILGGTNLELNSCLLSNVSHCPETANDEFSLTIYNPLSKKVASPISIPVQSQNWQVLDSEGKEVSSQTAPSLTDFSQIFPDLVAPYTLEFIAELPPLGYRVFTCTASSLSATKSKAASDTSFEIDDASGLLKSVTMNGVTVGVSQDLLHYKSGSSSQAYIFTPTSDDPQRVATGNVKTTKIDGDVFSGVLQEFSPWAKQFIKVYKNDASYVEFDWIVGPLDISENGKEVISRFTTDFKTDGIFYTDSNGREMLKRVRNYRPDFQYTDEQPVSGNYYPVTSKIVIRDEDQNLELAILNDRSQGGSSISDGQVELMIHRAINSEDNFGLNEIEYGKGIVVRGKHYLVLGPSGSLAAAEKDVAQRKKLQPWVFVTAGNILGKITTSSFSNLKAELPDNVQVLSLEPWKEDTLLLRLEHVFEKNEDPELSKEVTFDLTGAFNTFEITELKEMTLGANIPIEEAHRLQWPGSNIPATLQVKRDPQDLSVTLGPMQIRTFLAKVSYNN